MTYLVGGVLGSTSKRKRTANGVHHPSPVFGGGGAVRALFERSSKTRGRRRGKATVVLLLTPSVADYRATSPADGGGVDATSPRTHRRAGAGSAGVGGRV